MADKIKKTTRRILEENRQRQSPLEEHFVVLAHNIRSLHNVGSLFRSADAFGVRSLWLSGYTPAPPRPEISKTALGAEESVSWRHLEDPLADLETLRRQGYQIIGLEQAVGSELLTTHRPASPRVCLILGNEVTGIDEELIPMIDRFVEIPQFGEKHSLNVSVAAGVALYAYLVKVEALKKRSPDG